MKLLIILSLIHIFKTWHIFYNSGGWDDYPAQKYVHDHAMEDRAAPVITSAVTVLCARILKMVAEKLGEDTAQYDADIAFYSKAIQDYAWDSDAGYFGYVEHDANGEPAGILRDDRGSNLNMGMDGVYPMIAGIVSEEQEKVLLKHVKQDLVTPYGVGTVAHNAPYYRCLLYTSFMSQPYPLFTVQYSKAENTGLPPSCGTYVLSKITLPPVAMVGTITSFSLNSTETVWSAVMFIIWRD